MLDKKNIIPFTKEYFVSIGIDTNVVDNFFNNNFSECLVIRLSTVCLVPNNKGYSNSNQTHIHVTGNSRYFFFQPAVADSKTASSNDVKVITDISMANLNSLQNTSTNINPSDLDVQPSFTFVKVAKRQNQENQVQISKLRLDDQLFLQLRDCLYINDLLILFKYKSEGTTHLFALGIPYDYYNNLGLSISTKYIVLNTVATTVPKIPIPKALDTISAVYNKNDMVADIELIDDIIYQQQVFSAEPAETEYTPLPKAELATASVERYKRNATVGKEAITLAEYHCELDFTHETFVTRNNLRYIEAHHLIPLSKQASFDNSLDVKANIVALCPNCHAKLHYGTEDDIKPLLEKLYTERKTKLERSGIDITLETLFSYYC